MCWGFHSFAKGPVTFLVALVIQGHAIAQTIAAAASLVSKPCGVGAIATVAAQLNDQSSSRVPFTYSRWMRWVVQAFWERCVTMVQECGAVANHRMFTCASLCTKKSPVRIKPSIASSQRYPR